MSADIHIAPTNDPAKLWRIASRVAGLAVVAALVMLLGGVGLPPLWSRIILLVGLVALAAVLLRGKYAKFFSGPSAYVATACLLLLIVLAIFATELSPQNPYDLRQLDIMDGRQPP